MSKSNKNTIVATVAPTAKSDKKAKVVATPAAAKVARKGKGRPVTGAIETSSSDTSNGGHRHTIMGVSTSKLLKWMGANGWSVKEATAVLANLGLAVSPSTVTCQLYSGRAVAEGREPTHGGKAAELDRAQKGELEALREGVKAQVVKK